VGTPIITSYTIGFESTGMFYEIPCPDETCKRLEQELYQVVKDRMRAESRFYGKIHPYAARAEPTIVAALSEAAAHLGVEAKVGLTASASGFFAPQGRDIARARPSVPDLDLILSEYDPRIDGQRFENMEMEASFLIHFLGGIGYWAGCICPAIANRRRDTFDVHYQRSIENGIKVALLALATLRSHL
jgi:uridine phosphorylase